MKSLFIAFTVLASVFTKTSFANEEKVSPIVLQSFQNTFNAEKVEWKTINKNLYKAEFELNGFTVTAFYDAEGVLVATTRNVTLLQVPVTLQSALKKNYPHLWITELFELSNDDGTEYYLTLENADTKVILKSSGSARWSIYRKVHKP